MFHLVFLFETLVRIRIRHCIEILVETCVRIRYDESLTNTTQEFGHVGCVVL